MGTGSARGPSLEVPRPYFQIILSSLLGNLCRFDRGRAGWPRGLRGPCSVHREPKGGSRAGPAPSGPLMGVDRVECAVPVAPGAARKEPLA